MKSGLVAATLFAAASATGYLQTWEPINGNNYFTLGFKVQADAGYTTGYMGKDGNTHTESYGLEIYSYANATVNMEFFNSYKSQYMFSIIPVDIKPYTQSVSAMRMEAKNGQSINTFADREITLLKFTTTVTENVKTCGASFYDAATSSEPVEGLKPVCAYDPTTATNYEDSYWKYEPLAEMESIKEWYGAGAWWTYNLYN